MANPGPDEADSRSKYFVDIDRMVNEGLGGGQVTEDNGLIEDTTSTTLELPESALDNTVSPKRTTGKTEPNTSV